MPFNSPEAVKFRAEAGNAGGMVQLEKFFP